MSIKNDFPYFQLSHNHTNPVYLDNAATTQKPKAVIDAIRQFYEQDNANVHRSSFRSANKLTSLYEDTRALVADFIGAKDANNIVWTKGTTESINLVAYSWGQQHIRENDNIVVLGSEHHANFVPWQQLAKRKNAQFHVVNIKANGQPDLEHFESLIKKRPKLVALQHVSNALGNIHPIEHMCHLAKQMGATVIVDGAQAVGHFQVDVSKLNCDFYAFSGHKMYGPTGIGVLYIKDEIKPELSPFHYGGEMIESVTAEASTFRAIPYMLETGTPNIAGVIGLNAAVQYLLLDSTQNNKQKINRLYDYLVNQISDIEKVTIYGDRSNNIGVLSFTVEDESIADVTALLDQQGIAVRGGHHCAMPLMQALELDGTIRASLAIYNDEQDIDQFISALKQTIDLLDI